MAVEYALLGLKALLDGQNRKRRNKRGEEALDQAVQRILQNAGPAPSPEQAAALRQQADPVAQKLNAGQLRGPQSPIPTGQPNKQQQDTIALAQALQDAHQGTAGIDYLRAMTDPAYAEQLKQRQLQNERSQFELQQAQQQAAELNRFSQLDPAQLPEQFQNPATAAAFRANPRAAAATVLSQRGVYGDPLTAQQKLANDYLSADEDRRRALEFATRGQQVVDTGGGGKSVLTAERELAPLVSASDFGADVGAGEIAKQDVERRYAGQLGAEQAAAEETEVLGLIDRALSHEGFDATYGLSSMLPTRPGSDSADFEAILEQVAGKNFLTAFENLKGGGQITEREGQAAQAAISRIANTAQSEEAARAAWQELREIMQRGYARKRSQGTRNIAQEVLNPGSNPAGQVLDAEQRRKATLEKYGIR